MQVWIILGLALTFLFVVYAFIMAAGRSDEQAERMFEEWQRTHPTNRSEDEPRQKTAPEDKDAPEDKNLPSSRQP